MSQPVNLGFSATLSLSAEHTLKFNPYDILWVVQSHFMVNWFAVLAPYIRKI